MKVIAFHWLLADFRLGALEWGRVLIPTGDKSFDQHSDAGEVCALQGATAQDAPHFGWLVDSNNRRFLGCTLGLVSLFQRLMSTCTGVMHRPKKRWLE
jgi:hypothetical protein